MKDLCATFQFLEDYHFFHKFSDVPKFPQAISILPQTGRAFLVMKQNPGDTGKTGNDRKPGNSTYLWPRNHNVFLNAQYLVRDYQSNTCFQSVHGFVICVCNCSKMLIKHKILTFIQFTHVIPDNINYSVCSTAELNRICTLWVCLDCI